MKEELQVIMELMKDLQDKMEYTPDDLSDRLGRKEPGVEVMKIEGKLPTDKMSPMGIGGGGDDESMEDPMEEKSESPFEESMEDGSDMMSDSPEEKLKKRLMALRG